MLVMMWTKRNSHSLLVGMQNGTANLEETSAVSYQTKHTLSVYDLFAWDFLPSYQTILPLSRHRGGVLQFNSVLTLTTQN